MLKASVADEDGPASFELVDTFEMTYSPGSIAGSESQVTYISQTVDGQRGSNPTTYVGQIKLLYTRHIAVVIRFPEIYSLMKYSKFSSMHERLMAWVRIEELCGNIYKSL